MITSTSQHEQTATGKAMAAPTCPTCKAPPVIIHFADCRHANRAQHHGAYRNAAQLAAAEDLSNSADFTDGGGWTYDEIIAREA